VPVRGNCLSLAPVHQSKQYLLRKFRRSRKRSRKPVVHITTEDESHVVRREEREELLKKLKKWKQPAEKWVNKKGPCDTWRKSGDRIWSPHKSRVPYRYTRDGSEFVTNSVQQPAGLFKFHQLGFYQKENFLCEKLVRKLKPAFNKAARLFRPYMGCDKFAFALRCCVHFGFTTKRIKDLLRMGDLIRRGLRSQARDHLRRWICANFDKKKRKEVILDYNITLFEDDMDDNDMRHMTTSYGEKVDYGSESDSSDDSFISRYFGNLFPRRAYPHG